MRLSGMSTILVLLSLLCLGPLAEAGKGGKPGGGPPPDPAIAARVGNDLVVMNADGSNQNVLFSFPGGVGRPSWSPDGTQLAFTSDVQGPGVYVAGVDGTNLRKVTYLDTTPAYGEYRGSVAWSPVPAPDGEYKIAFADTPLLGDGSLGPPDVFVVNLDGSGRQNLTEPLGLAEGSPSWSPAGDRLAVGVGPIGGRKVDVAVLDLGSSGGALVVLGLTNLTDEGDNPGGPLNAADVTGPQWSNGGGRIAVHVSTYLLDGGMPDIWAIDPASPASPLRVTNTPDLEERNFTWSPDDSQLLGYVWHNPKRNGLYLMAADGSGTSSLFMRVSAVWVPTWRR